MELNRCKKNDHFFKEESLARVLRFDFLVDFRHYELIVHIFLKYFDDSRLQFRKILQQMRSLLWTEVWSPLFGGGFYI